MKRRMILAAAALAVAAAAGPVSAEELDVPPYPAALPWQKVTDKANDEQRLIEWIPADQSTTAISDILTVQTFKRLRGRDPAQFMTGFLQRFGGACRGARVNGPKAGVEDGLKVAYGQVYCVGHKAAREDLEIVAKVISGDEGLYMVQREFRRPEVAGRTAGVMAFEAGEEDKVRALFAAMRTANEHLAQVRVCGSGRQCPAVAR